MWLPKITLWLVIIIPCTQHTIDYQVSRKDPSGMRALKQIIGLKIMYFQKDASKIALCMPPRLDGSFLLMVSVLQQSCVQLHELYLYPAVTTILMSFLVELDPHSSSHKLRGSEM
jgi:hypothetical protein